MSSPDKTGRRRFLKIMAGAGALMVAGAGAVYSWLSPKPAQEPIVACCGINCVACPDGHFQVSCDGCLSTSGRLSNYGSEICEIRPCVQEKGILNCAYCSDYDCEKLRVIHNSFPGAKATLDAINRNL
ncbi:MAG: DUF3795 domain-containing protein [Candidatus Bathyarchaeota archaeon]|nr:DUF3795 domain-containing protein [Candidatus Bathyarchaeota archaeon]